MVSQHHHRQIQRQLRQYYQSGILSHVGYTTRIHGPEVMNSAAQGVGGRAGRNRWNFESKTLYFARQLRLTSPNMVKSEVADRSTSKENQLASKTHWLIIGLS